MGNKGPNPQVKRVAKGLNKFGGGKKSGPPKNPENPPSLPAPQGILSINGENTKGINSGYFW